MEHRRLRPTVTEVALHPPDKLGPDDRAEPIGLEIGDLVPATDHEHVGPELTQHTDQPGREVQVRVAASQPPAFMQHAMTEPHVSFVGVPGTTRVGLGEIDERDVEIGVGGERVERRDAMGRHDRCEDDDSRVPHVLRSISSAL
jgi:hypothetical protein